MSGPQVTLFIRIRTADKKRCYKRPVYSGNGRLKALYAAWLRKQGYADRTINNRIMRVNCFLKKYGITNLLDEGDKRSLKFVEKVVDAYTEEELKALFAAATERERLIFQFFLGSGCREAEVANATWRDVNFADETFVVHYKPKRGFMPKDKSERRIPLPDSLINSLRAWRKTHADSIYLFPNQHGKPEGHLLRKLKVVAKRAGLNCGECPAVGEHKRQSCLTAPVCGKFELHKFRRSFATHHHEHSATPKSTCRATATARSSRRSYPRTSAGAGHHWMGRGSRISRRDSLARPCLHSQIGAGQGRANDKIERMSTVAALRARS